MPKSKILVLVSGSIAAYKACYLVSKLVQNGFAVKVAASNSALNFVGATTFEALSGQEVAKDTFEAGRALDHIYLIRDADLVICVPATGNFINKVANGIADDFLTTLALAHDFSKPFLIAPAMNTQMYLHPATQLSVGKLREYGFGILETASGVLACQEVGSGKLLDPDLIFDEIVKALGQKPQAKAIETIKMPKILITSGGCVEKIDNVRAITNTSSGKTGARLADILSDFGFEVHFLTAKSGARPNAKVETTIFTDFKSLEHELYNALGKNDFDFVIHTAAVSDYSVKEVLVGGNATDTDTKIPSTNQEIEIKLVKNPKLINQIKQKSPKSKLIGFKLTNNIDDADVAVKKQILEANCDLVVHNALEQISGDKTQHSFNVFGKTSEKITELKGVDALGAFISNYIMWGVR